MKDDLAQSVRAISQAGTLKNKRLPAASTPPVIPPRAGASAPITQASSGSGSVDMTLGGPKTYTTTDGVFTLSFPESASATVGTKVLTFPAINAVTAP